MKFMILTNDVDFAKDAESAGVHRIFVDLEYLNKAERQRGLNTVLSQHSLEDVANIRSVITKSKLLVRVNPINPMSKEEIEKVIALGADIVMLPMVYDEKDAEEFVDIVAGRAKTIVMIETSTAVAKIDDLISVDGIDEFFIGLNDLKISFGLDFMFEVLSGGIVEYLITKISKSNIPVGFGGIAKLGDGNLSAELILSEHVRLKSNSVILSRTFKNDPSLSISNTEPVNLEIELEKLRKKHEELSNSEKKVLINNKDELNRKVKAISKKIVSNRRGVSFA